MKRPLARFLVPTALLLSSLPVPLSATGYYGPSEYLARGGRNLVLAPEFYWDLEVKRLASAYHPPEKFLLESAKTSRAEGSEARLGALSALTVEADSADFLDALKTGKIKPPDVALATEQHDAARSLLAARTVTPPLGAEFNSEFADYHRGALAYRLGKEHWEEARTAWEALLKRPEAERHYRTVWATFMLGKIALKRGEPEAAKWFQQTRALAKSGLADSLGLAADSYGWEARSEWKQGHPEKAAPLYLTQLALGDESAIYSLKALIPDREPVDGVLNYGPTGEEVRKFTPAEDAAAEKQLKAAAADPLLRRLVTVHILATETNRALGWEGSSGANARCTRWLRILKETKLTGLEDAEYLGWVGYTNGNYREAADWLKLANAGAPAACWLRSKLERRAGKLAEARTSMAKAFQSLRTTADYTHWAPAVPDDSDSPDGPISGESWSFPAAAAGNLGALNLERAEFIDALDTFLHGGLWNDAAYVAERVLAADELKAYVDKAATRTVGAEAKPDADAAAKPNTDSGDDLRYLLGRRLVREDRYADAAPYMKAPYDGVLEKYVQALKAAANEKLPKAERARAWFRAAWIARYDGMELMGTEVAPDGFSSEGAFPNTDIVAEREKGRYEETRYENGESKKVVVSIAAQPSKQELQRLKQNRINPEIRFHYRVIAGALAMRAAALLPDGSEELADTINQAGLWVKDRDQKVADRYFLVVAQRCPSTELGRAMLKKRSFVDQTGPWSEQEKSASEPREK